MKVPFLDLKASYLELKDELDAAYHRVMNSGWYILGEEVEAFESEFAGYVVAVFLYGAKVESWGTVKILFNRFVAFQHRVLGTH